MPPLWRTSSVNLDNTTGVFHRNLIDWIIMKLLIKQSHNLHWHDLISNKSLPPLASLMVLLYFLQSLDCRDKTITGQSTPSVITPGIDSPYPSLWSIRLGKLQTVAVRTLLCWVKYHRSAEWENAFHSFSLPFLMVSICHCSTESLVSLSDDVTTVCIYAKRRKSTSKCMYKEACPWLVVAMVRWPCRTVLQIVSQQKHNGS